MKGLYEALHEHHQRLQGLFDTLENRVHAGDFQAADEAWTELDRGLMAHLEAEEETMLPFFDQVDSAEAAAIRAEHAKMRSLFADLGVGMELHILREDRLKETLEFIRAHAAREEATLYRWADQELPEPSATTVIERLRAVGNAVKKAAKHAFESPPVV